MQGQYWDELDSLGQNMLALNRLLRKAEEYGDQPESRRLRAELFKIETRRQEILASIAELSVAA